MKTNRISYRNFFLVIGFMLIAAGISPLHANEFSITTLQVYEDHIRIYYSLDEDIVDDIAHISINYFYDYPNIDETIQTDEFQGTGYLIWPLDVELTQPVSFQLIADREASGVIATNFHSIIFLKSVSSVAEQCEVAVNAEWINYTIHHSLGAPPAPLPFDEVKLYAFPMTNGACDTGNGTLLGSLPQPLWNSNETFSVPPDMLGETYCLQVVSSDSDETIQATSNIISITLDEIESPDKPVIDYVSVLDNELMEIRVQADDSNTFVYRLFRSNDPGATVEDYELIKEEEYQGEQIPFTDNGVHSFDTGPWFYYVEAKVPGCPDLNAESELHSSIFLQAEMDAAFDPDVDHALAVELSWLHEPPFEDEVYSLVRQIEGQPEEVLPDFDFGNSSFTDEIEQNLLGGITRYWIAAYWTDGTQQETIYSNIAEISFDILSLEDIPKAFRPDSDIKENRSFWIDFLIPPDPQHYSLKIFDRHGLLIYEETEWQQDEGWDGTLLNGEMAPAGPYVWELRYNEPGSTETIAEKGVVNLVR